MDIFILWLFVQADSIRSMLSFVAGIAVFITLIVAALWFYFAYIERNEEMVQVFGKLLNKLVIVVVVGAGLTVAIPSSQGIAMIVGGKLAIEGITSEPVVGTAKKIHELVNRKLDEAIAEGE